MTRMVICVEGDVSVLQHRGGEQRWKFYRPDPFHVGRSTSNATTCTSSSDACKTSRLKLFDIGLILLCQPPDGDFSKFTSPVVSSVYLEDDHEAFLVEVNQDLQGDQVPIMFEYQFWSVAQHRFYGILEPRMHSRLVRGFSPDAP